MEVFNSDLSRISYALRVASTSQHRRYRHGAILVRGGNIVAASPNKIKNDPSLMYDFALCSVHAEVAVMKMAPNSTVGAILYVARIGARGNFALSYPCDNCAVAMQRQGISKIVWTEDNGGVQACRVRDLVALINLKKTA